MKLGQMSHTVTAGSTDPLLYALVVGQPAPFDLDAVVAAVMPGLTASGLAIAGHDHTVRAPIQAWISQDDDAHEPCSLTACRHPLHPGPCKGWKGTLHSVAPGAYKQIEAERVKKANARRVKRIEDLRAQGKPIPRRLLTEIKEKPAPGHPAQGAQAVPLGQVNQKADLAGGQAHHAGQAISKAAGVQVKTAPPLPLGPKKQKPTVAGRGPAFVITQAKVTDTYKLDKADKITPQEWAALSDADKTTIRNELTAIKARGFGPQQTKADALLLKLYAPNQPGTAPGAPPTPGTPGKVTLGQATKTPTLPAPAPQAKRGSRDSLGVLNRPAPGGSVTSTSVGLPPGYRISRDGMGYSLKHNGKLIRTSATQDALEKYAKDHHAAATLGMPAPAGPNAPAAPKAGPDIADQVKKAQDPSAKLTPAARVFIYRKMDKAQFDALDDTTKKKVRDDLDELTKPGGSQTAARLAGELKTKFGPGASGTPSTPSPAAPASSPGIAPSAPSAPGAPAHVQHARAVANRTAPKATMGKTHVDAYGKLSKADFDSLPADQQRTIRDDLANAKGKFLDPKKQQAAQDLLDRFGSKHPAPAAAKGAPTHVDDIKVGDTFTDAKGTYVITETPAQGKIKGYRMTSTAHNGREVLATRAQVANDFGLPSGPRGADPKGYSDPMNEAVKAASTGLIDTDNVLKTVARLSPATVSKLDDDDRKKILGRLAFVATHPKATPEQKEKATAFGRIINSGSPAARGLKLDHEPSLGELHAEEKKTGALNPIHALGAARDKAMDKTDRLKALGALTKAQFDDLTPDEQRQITDALQGLHYDRIMNGGQLTVDAAVEEAIKKYTGMPAGPHRLAQAEADFKAGKITGDKLHSEFLTARAQAHSAPLVRDALVTEAVRIAKTNPSLPSYVRARLAGEPKYGDPAYSAVHLAQGKHNWDDAPRLSGSDITALFRPTAADLGGLDPIHAQAIRDLRANVIRTGLRGDPGVPSGSPWSLATRNAVVDGLLDIPSGMHRPSLERVAEFKAMPDADQKLVLKVLKDRLDSQTNLNAKTGTYITMRELDGSAPLSAVQASSLIDAADSHRAPSKLDTWSKLTPAEYAAFPPYAKGAISAQLRALQDQSIRNGGVQSLGPNDDLLKVMPEALNDELRGASPTYSSAQQRVAVQIARHGAGIIPANDRVAAYRMLGMGMARHLYPADSDAISADLDKIANDASLPPTQRFNALYTGDFSLALPGRAVGNLDADQLIAVASAQPNRPVPDSDAITNFGALSRAGYDQLHPVYRDAIDRRVSQLPAPQMTALDAKFHQAVTPGVPAAPAATPGGYTPTTVQPNVPVHVQAALDTIYGVHPSGKSHTMAHQLSVYGALRGSDFQSLNGQEQGQLLGDLSFIATTAKGPSADKAKKLIDRFTPPGTPAGQVPTGAAIPPANAVPGQVRYATPLKGLAKAKDSGKSGDGWISLPGGGRVWGAHGAAGLLLKHTDPQTGEERYLMVQRGPAISDPGKWTFPGGASDSKETPHEGATRETIEELGLKDDVFKDALVHGDHTFSVPNSTWKYTTVAASVPTMIKPNLTTAHARAETSDAKWLTLAEIRALDKRGDLHHPIAGGKLETNVISLYPAAGSQKLGQIARPGPVSKRLGRLAMPSGGRQAPASFNAWPHAHKPSKGKDLIPDKATFDAQRQRIKQDRKLYDGKTADGRLAAIGAQQGFDDTPTVMDKKEIDRLLATGDYIEVFRGVTGAGGGWSARSRGGSGGKTAADINEEMRSGPAYYGKGIFGNGYYLATQRRVAAQYADGTTGSVARMLIPKSAITQKYDKVSKESFASSSRNSKAKGAGYGETSTFWDPGRYAAAKGIDGIEIEPHHVSPSGGARHVASPGKPAFNWLNRSVLIMQKEPG